MIIKFTIGNFLSFKDKTTISFEAQKNYKDHKNAIFEIEPIIKNKFIKTAAIYGANASGKSNFVKAIKFFKYFITEFRPMGEGENKIPLVNEFLLSEETESQPSFFEIEIVIDGEIYIYGFEVSKKEIHGEWLKRKAGKKTFFKRQKQEIKPARDFEKEASQEIIARTREDVLFLTILADFNIELARKIKAEILKIIILDGTIPNSLYRFAISSYVDNPEFKKKMDEFIFEADFGIQKIEGKYGYISRREALNKAPDDLKEIVSLMDKLVQVPKDDVFQNELSSVHNKFSKEGKKISEVSFDFHSMESSGTQRMFFMSAQFAKILIEGGLLIIDEIDSALHPILCKFILKKFNSNQDNAKNAQLIFTTHDISFMHEDFLRKDQIWFVEKNKFGSSEIFSLSSLGEREGVSYSKRYLEGRYGAIPYVKYLEEDAE